MFNMVVYCFCAFDLGVEWECLTLCDLNSFSNLNSPDSFTCWSSVLLEDSLSVGQRGWELCNQISPFEVCNSVWGWEWCLIEVYETQFGIVFHESVWVWGTNNTSCAHLSQGLVEDSFTIWKISCVNSWNVSITILNHVFCDCFLPFVSEEDDFGGPAQFLEGFYNGDCVFSVSVPGLVTTTFCFENCYSSVKFLNLSHYTKDIFIFRYYAQKERD